MSMMNLARPFQKARQTNSTDTTSPSRVPTVVEPITVSPSSATSQEVIDFIEGGTGPIPFAAFIIPYGLGADNDAFSLSVIGWKKIGTDPNLTLWVPFLLGSYSTIISASVGVAGSPVINTERFADTITIVTEPTQTADVTRSGTTQIYSPTNNTPGWIRVPLRGCSKLELTFANVTNTPTKNALVSFLHDEF